MQELAIQSQEGIEETAEEQKADNVFEHPTLVDNATGSQVIKEVSRSTPSGNGGILINFPVYLTQESENDLYRANVPCIKNCSTTGRTMEDALQNVKETIRIVIKEKLAKGEVIPKPAALETYQADSQYTDGAWALAPINFSRIYGKSKRINITVPEQILERLDSFAREQGETRSGFLVQAAIEYIASHREMQA